MPISPNTYSYLTYIWTVVSVLYERHCNAQGFFVMMKLNMWTSGVVLCHTYVTSKQATAYHKLFLILSHFNNNEIARGSSRLWEVKFIISNTIQFTYSACLPPNQPALNLLLQISNSIPDKLTIIVYSHYYIIVLSNKHNSKAHLRLFLQYFWADNATGHWKLNP